MKGRKIISGIASLCIVPTAAVLAAAYSGDLSPQGATDALIKTVRTAAYLSAGAEPYTPFVIGNGVMLREFSPPATENPDLPVQPAQPVQPETAEPTTEQQPVQPQTVGARLLISQNFSEVTDELDREAEGNHSGEIIRTHYGKSESGEHITLESGAQVQNCTELSADALLAASEELPEITVHKGTSEPQVLIVHTHTTESYEPYSRDYYDEDFPFRTRDCRYNMVAVGERLARTLAKNGISVVHDGTEHDYPAYSGAYDRSEATIRAVLEQYPSIKVVIDLHRDAMANGDGSRIAPITEINGKNAAQFMIISGCDDGRFNMPEYMENFKLACLIQQSTERLYPGLARPVLFDYRNYNQHITTGSLLIEVGSHANSLDEALYTAELLGESMAISLSELSN